MEELQKEDLTIGGYYVSSNEYIFKANDFNNNMNPAISPTVKRRYYNSTGNTMGYGLKAPYKKATQQQREHLDACIAAGKYVDYEYAEEPKFKIGKWYKWYQEDHRTYHYGKMHKYDDKEHFSMKPWICRVKSYHNLGTFLTEKASNITLITDLFEIQQYLPDGHEDKFPVKEEMSDNLNVDDLIENETYSGIIKGAGEIIFIPEVCELYSNSISTPINSYSKANAPDQVRNIRKATDEEKQWLDACIKANKFIPKEKVKEKTIEYVKLLRDSSGFKEGDIAKVVDLFDDGYTVYVPNRESTSGYNPNVWYSKSYTSPSTKAAYEAQFKTDELTELPEKWYVKNDTKESHKVLGKWREAGPCGDMSSGLKPQGYLSYNKGYYYDTLNSVPKDLVEITFEQFKKWVLKDGESKNEKQNDVKEIIPKKGKWYDITAFGGANYIVRYNDTWYSCEYISGNLMYNPSGSFGNVKILRELKADDPKITEPLLEYAKKKYPIGCRFKAATSSGISDSVYTNTTKPYLFDSSGDFWIIGSMNLYCPTNGKWAEIVSLPEKTVSTEIPITSSKYKFKVGDSVKIVKDGYGLLPSEKGKVVTITELGDYDGDNGYKISPALGNTKSGGFNGFIGEESFELVKEESNLEKANKMFKVGMKVKSPWGDKITLQRYHFPLEENTRNNVFTKDGSRILYDTNRDKWATIESTSQLDHTETGIQWHEYLFDTGADWKYSGTLDHLGATHPMTTEDYVSKPSSDLIDVEIEVPITIGS